MLSWFGPWFAKAVIFCRANLLKFGTKAGTWLFCSNLLQCYLSISW
jgi:hypothetical protein